mgnify:CR=1 FL=1
MPTLETKVYEDAECIVYEQESEEKYPDGRHYWTGTRIENKAGSPGDNQDKARDLIQKALDNWGSLTALQKDKLLRLLCRYVLGRFDGT